MKYVMSFKVYITLHHKQHLFLKYIKSAPVKLLLYENKDNTLVMGYFDQIDVSLQVIVFSLEEILSHDREKNSCKI